MPEITTFIIIAVAIVVTIILTALFIHCRRAKLHKKRSSAKYGQEQLTIHQLRNIHLNNSNNSHQRESKESKDKSSTIKSPFTVSYRKGEKSTVTYDGYKSGTNDEAEGVSNPIFHGLNSTLSHIREDKNMSEHEPKLARINENQDNNNNNNNNINQDNPLMREDDVYFGNNINFDAMEIQAIQVQDEGDSDGDDLFDSADSNNEPFEEYGTEGIDKNNNNGNTTLHGDGDEYRDIANENINEYVDVGVGGDRDGGDENDNGNYNENENDHENETDSADDMFDDEDALNNKGNGLVINRVITPGDEQNMTTDGEETNGDALETADGD